MNKSVGSGLDLPAFPPPATALELVRMPEPTPRMAAVRVLGFYYALDPSMPSVKASRLSKVESRLDACVNRNRAARGVLVNHAALHYKYDAPDGRNVFQRIPIERDDIRLQTRRD